MVNEILMDLEELRHLLSVAKRPRVVSLISGEIENLKKLSVDSVPASSQPSASVVVSTKVSSSPALIYTPLPSFSWDQDNEKVKIYISLEGVQEEKVETLFRQSSVEVKLHDVQGKNYKFSIPKLYKEVVPEACKVLVKPKRVIITLPKSSKGNWLDLHFKEDKFKPNLDKEKDPMAGIMDLMKNMYEDGDEDMKRTIAKAMSDARSGTTADPSKGFR